MSAAKHTPAAQWRTNGEPDPHGTRYDCERAQLAMGTLSDDELANGVFLHGDGTHGRPPLTEIIAGRAFSPIAWLTAAKDRIRWLSRALERERSANADTAAALRAARAVAFSNGFDAALPEKLEALRALLRKLEGGAA